MTQPDPLQEMASQYRQEGFEVILRPMPEQLPPFFAAPDVLLFAFKNGEYRIFHAGPSSPTTTTTTPGGPQEPILMSGREPEPMYLRTLLAEAERCMRTGGIEAALLLGWSVVEAALREAARKPGSAFIRPSNPRELIRQMSSKGTLGQKEIALLEQAWHLRTMVVHGLRPDSLPPELVRDLLVLARRLIVAPPAGPATDPDLRFGSVVYGYGIRQVSEFLTLANQANRLLAEIVSHPSAPHLNVEWDRTEDNRGRSIVTLRLADFSGAVTGTFTSEELSNFQLLQNKLYRLWGDLLQVRNHQLLMELGRRGGALVS